MSPRPLYSLLPKRPTSDTAVGPPSLSALSHVTFVNPRSCSTLFQPFLCSAYFNRTPQSAPFSSTWDTTCFLKGIPLRVGMDSLHLNRSICFSVAIRTCGSTVSFILVNSKIPTSSALRTSLSSARHSNSF